MSAHDPKRTSTEALQTPTLFLPGDAFGAYRRRKVAIAAAGLRLIATGRRLRLRVSGGTLKRRHP